MKRFLMLLVTVFALCTLVACTGSNITVKGIEISGYVTEFNVGDEFTTGNLKVTASYSDSSTADVTDRAEVVQTANMNAIGTYVVVVLYEGEQATYEIKVAGELAALAAATEYAKVSYNVGDELSLENVVVYETYSDGSIVKVTDLSGYTVACYDAKGNAVEGAFAAFGAYTVEIAVGEIKTSYEIVVEPTAYDSIEDAITAGIANADKVNAGLAVVSYGGLDVFISDYAFGDGYFKVYDGSKEQHYQLLEDGSVFGIEVEDGNLSSLYGVTEANLNGVDFALIVNYEWPAVGVEQLVEALYYAGIGEDYPVFNFEEVCDSKFGAPYEYSFTYEIILYDYYYYYVEVGFSLNPATNAISAASVAMRGYYTDVMIDNGDGTYSPDPEYGSYDFDRYTVITQTCGERTQEVEYDVNDYLYETLELVDAEGNPVTKDSVVAGVVRNEVYLTIDNVIENSLDEIDVTILDADGFDTMYAYGNGDGDQIEIFVTKAGTYTVVISTAKTSISFTLEVEYADLTDFAPAIYNDWYELEEATEAEMFGGGSVVFSAVANAGADASFTYALKEEDENVSFDEWGNEVTFYCDVPGTYVVVLTSTVDETFTAELTITVAEPKNIADVLNGKYQDADGFYAVTFTPASEGALNGTIEIDEWGTIYSGTYTCYPALNNYLELKFEEDCPHSVYIDDSFNVVFLNSGYFENPLYPVEGGSTEKDPTVLAGIYTGTWIHPMMGMSYEMVLTFDNGTGTYSFMNGTYEGTFYYSLTAEGTFTAIILDADAVTSLSGSFADGVVSIVTSVDGGELMFDAE